MQITKYIKTVVSSDKFVAMSTEAQALYLQLLVNSDKRGVVYNAFALARAIGCASASKTLGELIDAGFVRNTEEEDDALLEFAYVIEQGAV